MALSLSECLREARSVPVFNGNSEYTLSNYLRDVNSVLHITPEEHHLVIKTILINKLQGRALRSVETLLNPSWEEILRKLKEDLGIKKSFFQLRTEALNTKASNIEELHYKLRKILAEMNTKFNLNPVDISFNPSNNEKIIFDIYINFLPLYIRSLLLQNNVTTIESANTFYIQNNILKDIKLINKTQNQFNEVRYNNQSFRNNVGNFRNNNWNTSGNHRNNFGNFGRDENRNLGNLRINNRQEPMEVENLQVVENFQRGSRVSDYP